MQQLDLLSIRKQPLQREPTISSKVIRAYVKQNLRGFVQRQRERERIRRLEQDKYQRQPSQKRKKEDHPNMRVVKVTYRALFQQPIGQLNPMGLKLPGQCPVELFQTGQNWQAREIASPARHVYKLGKFASLNDAKRTLAECFQAQLEDWQMWGAPPEHGNVQPVERMIQPGEIALLPDGKIGWKQPEDYTHILHGPLIDPKARVPNAACGVSVKAECFINNRANVEPSCKTCAEVWRREYKDK